jgi:tRNA A37 threonylcarbamoyladenosine biosynthesis protein TsaE
LVEWADRCPQALPERTVWVSFVIVAENERRIELSGTHPRAVELLKYIERTHQT